MISMAEYFSDGKIPGAKLEHVDAVRSRIENAEDLLAQVNHFLEDLEDQGVYTIKLDPDTGSQISGARGGSGDGGFRLQSSPTGRPGSAHKQGQGIDIYDPEDLLDDHISKYDEKDGYVNQLLEDYGLFREHPTATPGWCHLQSRAPGSGRRTFRP